MSRFRPEFHVRPEEAGWINDPNGLFFDEKNKKYYLFMQGNVKRGPVSGNIGWMWFESADLAHWVSRGVAVTPTEEGFGAGGAWSGSAFPSQGHDEPLLLYSCAAPWPSGLPQLLPEQQLCTSTFDPARQRYEPVSGNPLQKHPRQADPKQFRDPSSPIRALGVEPNAPGEAFLLMGTQYQSQAGVFAYSVSLPMSDAPHFHFESVLISQSMGPVKLPRGEKKNVWEMPELLLFPGDTRPALLKVSIDDEPRLDGSMSQYDVFIHGTGGVSSGKLAFEPGNWSRVDAGNFYASKVIRLPERHEKDTYLMFGWVREQFDPATPMEQDWAGVMSLPRFVSWDGEEPLVRPVPSLAKLRGKSHSETGVTVSTDRVTLWADVHQAEVLANVQFQGKNGTFELRLFEEADGKHAVSVFVRNNGEFGIDTTMASGPGWKGVSHGQLSETELEQVELDVFIDHSIVEAFVNGKVVTARAYPDEGHGWVSLTSTEEASVDVTMWEMSPTLVGDDGKDEFGLRTGYSMLMMLLAALVFLTVVWKMKLAFERYRTRICDQITKSVSQTKLGQRSASDLSKLERKIEVQQEDSWLLRNGSGDISEQLYNSMIA
eukprot:CAMPEP_0194032568 /NCGR_PEP_ID=MMETSP0009_2-20130614/5483_1 /TAXON_ID=210454 /ORGANISM="Grammatophora oceanica, Strain CCMP 410" /LENGTH=601 /DNA_ID=CAMNT_0038673053 /DNA_START=130 /DNA_END=1935 /DNA_ORIENTATION=-